MQRSMARIKTVDLKAVFIWCAPFPLRVISLAYIRGCWLSVVVSSVPKRMSFYFFIRCWSFFIFTVSVGNFWWRIVTIYPPLQLYESPSPNKKSKQTQELRHTLWRSPGNVTGWTLDQRHISRTIWTQIPSELLGRVCLPIQPPQIVERQQKIHAHCPAGSIPTAWSQIPWNVEPVSKCFVVTWAL